MTIILVVTKEGKTEEKGEYVISKKMIIGSSVYCDIILSDKNISGMQCQIEPVKTGHILVTTMDAKKEVFLNDSKLKKNGRHPFRVDDTLKVGPFVLRIDPTKVTKEELLILNSEYEELV